MLTQHPIILITATTLAMAGAGPASSQQFPTKPLRILTSGIGGGNDVTARLIAQGLSNNLGQPVVVENRGSIVPGEVVSKAAPDGYSLLFGTNSLWRGALLRKTPYDPVKDFAPVAATVGFPTIMATTATIPATTVKEFIALAKAKPGALNYVMTSTGGSAHLASELFKSMAGVNLTGIAYKNAGTGIVDMIGGRMHLFFSAAGPVMPHVKAGKLRALGVTTLKTSALFPDLPTIAATIPGYEVEATYCVFAPAKTPASIIAILNKEILRVVNAPDMKEKFFNAGLEVVGSSPKELAELRRNDIVTVTKLIKQAGIQAEKE